MVNISPGGTTQYFDLALSKNICIHPYFHPLFLTEHCRRDADLPPVPGHEHRAPALPALLWGLTHGEAAPEGEGAGPEQVRGLGVVFVAVWARAEVHWEEMEGSEGSGDQQICCTPCMGNQLIVLYQSDVQLP